VYDIRWPGRHSGEQQHIADQPPMATCYSLHGQC